MHCTRLMTNRDLPQAIQIEHRSCVHVWSEQEWLWSFDRSGNGHIVCTDIDNRYDVLGYLIYCRHDRSFEIVNLAVTPHRRDEGVGTLLVQRVVDLCNERRPKVTALVSELNAPACDFFKHRGFRARLERRPYKEAGFDMDGYRFEWMPLRIREQRRMFPSNRITGFYKGGTQA